MPTICTSKLSMGSAGCHLSKQDNPVVYPRRVLDPEGKAFQIGFVPANS